MDYRPLYRWGTLYSLAQAVVRMPATPPLSDTTPVGANLCRYGPNFSVLSSSRSMGRNWYMGGLRTPDSNFSGTRTKPCNRKTRENTATQSMYIQQFNSSQIPPLHLCTTTTPTATAESPNNPGIYLQTMPCSNSHFTRLCV